jgi:HemY protein
MLRFLIALMLCIPVLLAGSWLLQNPGTVQINWFDYAITVHTAMVVLIVLMLCITISLISWLVFKLITWPQRRHARKKYRTLERGLFQLTQGVTALAMGDDDAAHEALKKASLALPDAPLPQLLRAQLLQRQGKHEDAQVYLKALMNHAMTAPLATRRLIEQHVAEREWLEATALAEEARRETPYDRWLALTLLDLYARERESTKMLALTEGWKWQSPIAKEERHRYAALAYFMAAEKQKDPHLKAQSLRHAVGYAPDFLPATIAYAEAMMADESPRRARKWLREAWVKGPSPLLIAPILRTLHDESPRAQERLLKPFLSGEPHALKHLLSAEQSLTERNFARARLSLEASLAMHESKTAATRMAEVEKELHGPDAANVWFARAADAPASPSWLCMQCATQHPQWQPHCNGCNHFDSLRYECPAPRGTSLEMTAHH